MERHYIKHIYIGSGRVVAVKDIVAIFAHTALLQKNTPKPKLPNIFLISQIDTLKQNMLSPKSHILLSSGEIVSTRLSTKAILNRYEKALHKYRV